MAVVAWLKSLPTSEILWVRGPLTLRNTSVCGSAWQFDRSPSRQFSSTSTGAPFPVGDFQYLKQLFPKARFMNNYGCTEALPRLTVSEVKRSHHPASEVGRAIKGIELRIAGGHETGLVEFRGRSASIGEVMPDGKIQEYDDWIRSGDLGKIGDEILNIFGRYDQIINLRGERISLIEMEHSMMRMPTVEHAIVWVEPSDHEEHRPIAVLGGSQAPDKKILTQCLRENMSSAAWPHPIYWTETWPLTSSGKTDRKQLQQLALSGELKSLDK